MPRVLLTGFCAVPGPRRVGVQLRHVIRALTPMHTVDLLVVREGDQAYVERQGSLRVLRVPTHEADLRSQIQAFQRALKRQLDGADYDVVHCRDSWSGIPVLEARARLGYAVVYDLTRSPLGETTLDPDLDAQYGRDEEACLLAADLVLAPTMTAVKALQGRGPQVPGSRVKLSPPGVDVDRFDFDELPSSGPPRILYVGAVEPGRGLRVLVRAMVAIAREVEARLVLAGPIAPGFEPVLRSGIRELGLEDKVDVLGPVDHDQLPTLLATATVCVVPTGAELAPNPTVLYPTKLLEYMACRCAIVAPRRETVMQVVEGNREALLFEPGDPIDLARQVLRLIGEPMLRRNLAANAYERVRRDFTASAARRAVRNAYHLLSERFVDRLAEEAAEEAPKVELLADDDFEATVFEEAPAPPPSDTALVTPLEDALVVLDEGTGSTSSGAVAEPPPPREADETMERTPVAPAPADSSELWTVASLAVAPGPAEDWLVSNLASVLDEDTSDRDGTPVEGVVAEAPPLGVGEGSFVAGEIDVPPPRPPPPPPPRDARHDDLTPPVEFTAASSLLGSHEPADPDTGSRTPPLERR